MNNIIKITQKASFKLKQIAFQHNTNQILFFVKGGGCSGFNYKLEPFYDKPHKLDEIINCQGIDLIVCNNSIMHLIGTEIDWNQDIMGESFKFNNPNAAMKCGCGTSFSIKS